ncbi:hypothetical protein ACFOWZ_30165 [Lentzea rhizosphaerae]|uniref:Secreted protein n=1 Tax=Lentzea rhizosphaerae TaxID=2041025 RepID=A0ABV8C1G7_9PSEU
MEFGRSVRRFAVGAVVAGVAVAGVVTPAQAAPSDSVQGASSCSYFKRAQVVNKWEVLHKLLDGELRNRTPETQQMVLERWVNDTRSTANEFRAEWNMFQAVFTAQVSQTVTQEHSVQQLARNHVNVPGWRTYYAKGSARQWYVVTDVTERQSNCSYRSWRVEGIVATTDSIVWENWDAGPA